MTGAHALCRRPQGHTECGQSGHRQDYPDPLDSTKSAPGDARRDVREHADPTGADALYEREWRQRQRRGVEQEAARLHREAEHPTPVMEQDPSRLHRSADRHDGKRRGGVVLAQVGARFVRVAEPISSTIAMAVETLIEML